MKGGFGVLSLQLAEVQEFPAATVSVIATQIHGRIMQFGDAGHRFQSILQTSVCVCVTILVTG